MTNIHLSASGKRHQNETKSFISPKINELKSCGFHRPISEWLIKNATDYIVSGGYKDAGYEYVIIDDCWLEMERDPVTKELVPDRKRFPSGMKALADYVCII